MGPPLRRSKDRLLIQTAIVIPWRPSGDRPERQKNFDFLRRYVGQWFGDMPLILADTPHERFNRGAARNHGVQEAQAMGARTVLLLDADTVPEPYAVREAAYQADHDNKLHIPYTTFKALSQSGTRRAMRGLPMSKQSYDECHDHATGGALVIRPDAYWKAGGHPELVGWGFEDTIFRITADAILGNSVRHTGFIYHLYHKNEWNLGSPEYLANKAVSDEYVAAEGNPVAIRDLISRRDYGLQRSTP